jgi:uncharacterized protein
VPSQVGPFTVKPVELGGRSELGCFATRRIEAGERICTFEGTLHSRAASLALIESGQTRTGADPLELGLDLYMQVVEPYLYFNHSCEPNAGFAGRCDLVALRAIAPDEAITCDYATNTSVYNAYVMPFECACGAPTCRRRIGNLGTVPLDRLRTYFAAGALQDHVREEARDLLRSAGLLR